jgi:hypothetical protein
MMTTYTYGQLEGLWINNGGSTAMAPVMAAIALAESGGNPAAKNSTDNGGTQTSWGLWQLSDGTHNQPVANILDPNVNAAQAVKKSKSQGLTAWGTYTSGAYKKYLQQGVSAVTNGLPTGSTSTATSGTAQDASITGDIGSAIGKGFADAFTSIFQPLINTIIWGVEALLGTAMIVGGIFIMINNSAAGKELEGDAAVATTAVVAPEALPEVDMAVKAKQQQMKQKKEMPNA